MTDPGLPDNTAAGATPPQPISPFQAQVHAAPVQPAADIAQISGPAPKKRIGLSAALISGGALLLALIIAGGVWFAIETKAHTPQAAVKPFMDALVKGDVAKAVKTGNIDTSSPLVTQKAYSATKDRITGYSIKPSSTEPGAATVVVGYKLAGDRHTETFQLKDNGKELLFFTKWTLEPVTLPTVKLTVAGPSKAGVAVNGTQISIDDNGSAVLDVLPGRYNATMASSDDYTAEDAGTTVTSIKASGTASNEAVTLTARLTDAGAKAADNAVNAWVAECIGTPSLQPAGCSFGLIDDYPDLQLSNQKWTLVTAPNFSVGDWDGSGWAVDTISTGAATFLADASDANGDTGTVFSQAPVAVTVTGEIVGFDATGKAIFESIDWSGKASLPTA
ncbi:MAG TPA: hypothetical protein VG369_02435 [Humibacter sp.]|jgi:hypothetical protein|nr:hypothetical protein [Humibacter sp.]